MSFILKWCWSPLWWWWCWSWRTLIYRNYNITQDTIRLGMALAESSSAPLFHLHLLPPTTLHSTSSSRCGNAARLPWAANTCGRGFNYSSSSAFCSPQEMQLKSRLTSDSAICARFAASAPPATDGTDGAASPGPPSSGSSKTGRQRSPEIDDDSQITIFSCNLCDVPVY